MRCLLLHPEDPPLDSGWACGSWDRVIDVGIARPQTYAKWREVLGCEVEPYPSLDQRDFAELRAMYNFGLGQVVDQQGLDWWDLTWVRWLDQVVDFVLTAKFVASIGSSDEIWTTSERYARVLDVVAPGRTRRVRAQGRRHRNRLGRLHRLTFNQVLEILGDKYDGSYSWRRRIAPAKANYSKPMVLLPSAYGNASRAALALAASLPDQEFLLVATRRSAWVDSVPRNTQRAWLSSYAAGEADQDELESLIGRWRKLQRSLNDHLELALLSGMGCFDTFPAYVREGVGIRNCWGSVLTSEPVVSVLCADEKNPYTRIPVLLAQKRGIATVACHHGALDGRYLFSDIAADRFLAKSAMEWDYMVRVCGMPQQTVRLSSGLKTGTRTRTLRQGGNAIVFFSEPYEASNCRAHEVYAEVLPALVCIAREHGRELVIKLHPFESLRDRKQLVTRVLGGEDRAVVRLVTGPMTDELMESAWFSVTVSSTAAVDCAARGIPAFLCVWFDRYGFGYGEQFVRFGAAMPLRAVEHIPAIPELLEGYEAARAEDFSPSVQPELLRELLFPNAASDAIDEQAQAERLWA